MTIEGRFVHVLGALGAGDTDRVALAVSGGGDSVALAHLAARCGPRRSWHILHVDHGMRDGSADDARWVCSLAAGLGMPASVLRVDVPPAGSREAAARRVRYHALDVAAAELGCRLVATAHTLDDQAETVLLRAVRGAGGRGMHGVRPVRGRFVRPLLGERRDGLRDWLREIGAAWLDDPTNDDTSLDRNWLRNVLMPQIEVRRGGAAVSLARFASIVATDSDALDDVAARRLAAVRRPTDGWIELGPDALAAPRAVASRVVLSALDELGARCDAGRVHRVLALAAADARAADLGRGVFAASRAGVVTLVSSRPRACDVGLSLGDTVEASEFGVRVRVSASPATGPWSWRCRLDDAPGRLALRGRRPGDRVTTTAGTRKVQDVLVDAKVPRQVRDRIPILSVDGAATAVVGLTTPPAGRGPYVHVSPLADGWWTR